MILYHACGEVVEFPEIRKSRYTKDFSWGFYCTNNFATLFLRNLYLITCLLYFVFDFFSRPTYDKKEVSHVLPVRGAKRIDKTSFSYLLLPSFNFSHKKRRTLRLFL